MVIPTGNPASPPTPAPGVVGISRTIIPVDYNATVEPKLNDEGIAVGIGIGIGIVFAVLIGGLRLYAKKKSKEKETEFECHTTAPGAQHYGGRSAQGRHERSDTYASTRRTASYGGGVQMEEFSRQDSRASRPPAGVGDPGHSRAPSAGADRRQQSFDRRTDGPMSGVDRVTFAGDPPSPDRHARDAADDNRHSRVQSTASRRDELPPRPSSGPPPRDDDRMRSQSADRYNDDLPRRFTPQEPNSSQSQRRDDPPQGRDLQQQQQPQTRVIQMPRLQTPEAQPSFDRQSTNAYYEERDNRDRYDRDRADRPRDHMDRGPGYNDDGYRRNSPPSSAPDGVRPPDRNPPADGYNRGGDQSDRDGYNRPNNIYGGDRDRDRDRGYYTGGGGGGDQRGWNREDDRYSPRNDRDFI